MAVCITPRKISSSGKPVKKPEAEGRDEAGCGPRRGPIASGRRITNSINAQARSRRGRRVPATDRRSPGEADLREGRSPQRAPPERHPIAIGMPAATYRYAGSMDANGNVRLMMRIIGATDRASAMTVWVRTGS